MSIRTATIPTVFIIAPLIISVVSIAALISLPHNLLVWQVGAWSLAIMALVLLVALPATAYSLARNAATRTWPRGVAFAAGILYMALLALGAMF